jgi:hypothetical protein
MAVEERELTSKQAFGITQALINAYPELAKVWELYLAGNETDSELAYYATDYYKNLTTTAKNRSILKASQAGAYAQLLEDYKITQRKRLVAAGISDASDAVLEDAFLKGFTDNQLDLVALKATRAPVGGKALTDANAIKTYANQLGMTYNPSAYNSFASSIFEGTATLEDVKLKVRQDAMSAYPIYAEQLNKGVTMDSISSAYKSSIASILEIDPDSIGYDNRYLRQALQFIGPDGKPAMKPIWQFEKELRSTPEWATTKNARDSLDSLTLKVGRDMGLI